MTRAASPFAHVEASMRPRPTGTTYARWGMTAPVYLNPAMRDEQVYDALTGQLYTFDAWGEVVLERIRDAAPELARVLQRLVTAPAYAAGRDALPYEFLDQIKTALAHAQGQP